jgi:replicative DNA helicase
MQNISHFDISIHESAIEAERNLLGSLFEQPELWARCGAVTVDDFLLSTHRRIWQALERLHAENRPVDVAFVASELHDPDAAVYCGLMVRGVLLSDIDLYIREVKARALLRSVGEQIESLPESLHSVVELRRRLQMIADVLDGGAR